MGQLVTVAQAAYLVRRNERSVRWHLGRDLVATVGEDGHTQIDLDALGKVRAWRVDPQRLAELAAQAGRAPETIAARMAGLERELASLRADLRELRGRVRALEGRSPAPTSTPETGGEGEIGTIYRPETPRPPDGPYSASGGVLGASGLLGLAPEARGIESMTPVTPRPVAFLDRGSGAPEELKTKTDAARWLDRHGVPLNTAKGWEDLAAGMTSRAALQVAIARKRGPEPWKAKWPLHRCDDPLCVCHELLER